MDFVSGGLAASMVGGQRADGLCERIARLYAQRLGLPRELEPNVCVHMDHETGAYVFTMWQGSSLGEDHGPMNYAITVDQIELYIGDTAELVADEFVRRTVETVEATARTAHARSLRASMDETGEVYGC
jgi:hypothetical protein